MMDAPYPVDAPPAPPGRPWRVTGYRVIRARVVGLRVIGDYRWYWQANIVSFLCHHLLGMGCNTWKAR